MVRLLSVLAALARSLSLNLVRILRRLKDLLLIHDTLAAAHASDVAATDASRICICVYAHDGVAFLGCNIIGKLHRDGFLLHGV